VFRSGHTHPRQHHCTAPTAGVSQSLLDETARQALYQATKGILRKVNKLVMTALLLAATRKLSVVNEAILLDATTEALL
jgi:type II secretory pathway predicted ATPase ExeA